MLNGTLAFNAIDNETVWAAADEVVADILMLASLLPYSVDSLAGEQYDIVSIWRGYCMDSKLIQVIWYFCHRPKMLYEM